MAVLQEYNRHHSISSTKTTPTTRAWVKIVIRLEMGLPFQVDAGFGKIRGCFSGKKRWKFEE